MGALAATAGRKLSTALLGAAGGRLAAVDRTTLIVRGGRSLYAASAVYIGLAWYTGWRAQRVTPGQGRFPIPGLTKLPVINPAGSADAEDIPDVRAAGYGDIAGPPTPTGTPGRGPVAGPPTPGKGGSPNLLLYIAEVGRKTFHLTPGEHPRYGGVHAGHSPSSFHRSGRGIDFTGTPANLAAFAQWVAKNYGDRVSELFWRGPNWVNIDNGRPQPYNYSGALYGSDKHTRHVHLAI